MGLQPRGHTGKSIEARLSARSRPRPTALNTTTGHGCPTRGKRPPRWRIAQTMSHGRGRKGCRHVHRPCLRSPCPRCTCPPSPEGEASRCTRCSCSPCRRRDGRSTSESLLPPRRSDDPGAHGGAPPRHADGRALARRDRQQHRPPGQSLALRHTPRGGRRDLRVSGGTASRQDDDRRWHRGHGRQHQSGHAVVRPQRGAQHDSREVDYARWQSRGFFDRLPELLPLPVRDQMSRRLPWPRDSAEDTGGQPALPNANVAQRAQDTERL